MTPLARLLRAERHAPEVAPPAPMAAPLETPAEAHARGQAEGLMMLEHALAEARADADADRVRLQAAMAAAVDALADAFVAEVGMLAHAIAAHVLGTVPDAAAQALATILADLEATGTVGAELRAHPDGVATLETLCTATGLSVTADPALSAGMVAARTASGERVDSLAMRLGRVAAVVVEQPE